MPIHSATAFSKPQLCVTGPAAISRCTVTLATRASCPLSQLGPPTLTQHLAEGLARPGMLWAWWGWVWGHVTGALAGLQQASSGDFLHGTTGRSVWGSRDALHGSRCPRKAGSSRGRAVQPAASRLCSCSPQHSGVTQGWPEQGTARRLSPQRSACPALRTGQHRAAPSCAWGRSQLRLQLAKAPSARQSSPHLPQRLPALSCHPCPGKRPIPAVTRAESRSGPCPSRMKDAGLWPCSVKRLCCVTEGCAGKTFCPNYPHSVTPAPHCSLWSPVPTCAGCHPGKMAEE